MKREEIDDKIIDEEEITVKKIIKKIVTIGLSLFLLLMIIVYFVFGGYLFPVLESRLIGFSLDDDLSVMLPNNERIVFDPNVYNRLKEVYFSEQEHEFKACLIGEKEGSNYFVTDLRIPIILSQSFGHVTSEGCDEQTIISLHSHPSLWCRFSQQDIQSYESFLRLNPDGLAGIMCDTNRFNFYGY